MWVSPDFCWYQHILIMALLETAGEVNFCLVSIDWNPCNRSSSQEEEILWLFMKRLMKYQKTILLWVIFKLMLTLAERPTMCIRIRIRGYFGPYFPALGLNTDQNHSKYGHFSCSAKTRRSELLHSMYCISHVFLIWCRLTVCYKFDNWKKLLGLSIPFKKCNNIRWKCTDLG